MRSRRTAGLGVVALCAGLLGVLALAPAAQAAKYFHSPSGNIGCGVSRQGARCDIREKNWSPPPRPRSCNLDWGYGLTLGKRGKGRFFCGSDSLLGVGTRLGDGVQCFNVRNGHGFFIARERYRRF
jgi:hypothetical protein